MYTLFRSYILFIGSILLTLLSMPVFANSYVPNEYYANYQIADEWEKLLDLSIEIDAAWKVGTDLESETFRDLNDIFETIFDYFPSDPNSELVYKKCFLTTKELQYKVSRNGYTKFREQCFSPLSQLINKIKSDYTVKPKISVKPNSGNTPLNVTLDARNSIDPSNDTIPSDYFFWRYRDINGDDQPIGKGPVVNYTFTDPGNHIVHLTVRSSNNEEEGIFDGEASVAINVAPKSANVIVYANGKRLNTDDVVRLGTQDAQGGILLDATATSPIGARTILEHVWEISSNEQRYKFKKSGEGAPGQFVHIFPGNGMYQITLSLVDNENNRIQERYQLSVSDPVAMIKLKPEQGTTSSTYNFDASASYSLTSRIKTYQWEITNPAGERIDILESKKLTKKFTMPGMYSAKLTVIDNLGNMSYDIEQFYVASTPPVPSFIVTPSSDLQQPSQFTLDASSSFDEDMLNGNDTLTYNRSYTPGDSVTLDAKDPLNKEISLTFDKVGTYTIKLLVEDLYGEIAEIAKDIKVTSTLRPTMQISPRIAHRGTEIMFTAQTNKPVSFYEWNFGDGKVQNSTSPSVSHKYKKAGVYTISLRVVDENGEENIIRNQLFMGQKDMPVVGYNVKGKQSTILQPQSSCENASGDIVDAYYVERYENIILDATKSLNTQGTSTDLITTMHPNNNEVFSRASLNHNFLELGCTYIDLYVEDTNVGKTAHERVWFDVHNALPIIQNIILDFPQPGGGNTVGVGAATQQVSQRDIFTNNAIDPIVVRVQAKGTRDPDGFISHYARYYYESNNPNNIISLKITPADVASTSFIVPKPHNPTEYAFAVRIVDNDGGEVTSEDILGKGPIIFFPPGENNLDVPIVTLKADKPQVKVGDEITFTTDARILSQKPDFSATRYFKYDFDGDGVYDLTSKQETIQYRYEKAGEMHPKVAVYYRGRAGIGVSESIIVQKGLKPVFLSSSFGKDIIIQNASRGDIESFSACMDIRLCRNDVNWIIKDTDVFHFQYEEFGDYFMQFDVIDAFGNTETIRQKITLQDDQDPLGVMTIPNVIVEDGVPTINVGSSLNNEVTFYIAYTNGSCYVDSDISVDSDQDGDPTNDSNIACNQLVSTTFVPTKKQQTARIYYAFEGRKLSKDITINFLEYEQVLSEEYIGFYNEIDEVLSVLPEDTTNDIEGFYKDLLINLRDSLGEKDEMNSVLIQLRDLLAESPDMLTSVQKQRVMMLVNSLSDSTVKQAFGGTVYDTAKSNILAWFNQETAKEIEVLFTTFEGQQGNKDEMKATLDEIFKITGREQQSGNLDMVDMTYIQKNLCDIIVYYDLPSKTCGTALEINEDIEVTGAENRDTGGERSLTQKIVRVVIIVAIILAIIFGVLVILFALKAKRQQDDYDDEDDFEDEHDISDIGSTPAEPTSSDTNTSTTVDTNDIHTGAEETEEV